MPKAGRQQGRSEVHALRGRVDAQHVYLAESVWVQLCPVEADHPAVAFGEQKAGRIEPRFGLSRGKVTPSPPPLFRVGRERRRVDGEPRFFVLSRYERPDAHTRRWVDIREVGQGSAQLPQGADSLVARSVGKVATALRWPCDHNKSRVLVALASAA